MKGERAAVRGTIDGCLSVLGIVIGAYGAEPALLLSAALAGNVAGGISNLLAAFSAESAQHSAHLRTLERAMLRDLRGTEVEQAAHLRARREALIDSLATLTGGFVPIIPFILFTGPRAISFAITGSFLVMLVLGMWIGRFSRQGMLWSAVKLAALSLLTALACLLINALVAPSLFASRW